jgi:hypothetical protein
MEGFSLFAPALGGARFRIQVSGFLHFPRPERATSSKSPTQDRSADHLSSASSDVIDPANALEHVHPIGEQSLSLALPRHLSNQTA